MKRVDCNGTISAQGTMMHHFEEQNKQTGNKQVVNFTIVFNFKRISICLSAWELVRRILWPYRSISLSLL